jgi:hypothetical protein
MKSAASWKLTTTPPWPMLSSLAWLLTRCQNGVALRYRAFSLRHEDRCACGHRIGRTLATDPRAGHRLAHSRVLWCDRKLSPIAPRCVSTTRRMRSGTSHDPQTCAVGATDRAPPRATSPNPVSLPHTVLCPCADANQGSTLSARSVGPQRRRPRGGARQSTRPRRLDERVRTVTKLRAACQ